MRLSLVDHCSVVKITCACEAVASSSSSVLLSCHSADAAEMKRWLREKLLSAHRRCFRRRDTGGLTVARQEDARSPGGLLICQRLSLLGSASYESCVSKVDYCYVLTVEKLSGACRSLSEIRAANRLVTQ